jgi:hypothetical protein
MTTDAERPRLLIMGSIAGVHVQISVPMGDRARVEGVADAISVQRCRMSVPAWPTVPIAAAVKVGPLGNGRKLT